jgi:hypothetical protein
LETELLRMLEESSANAGTPQGRPGGLGVTITGGSTNLPAITNPLPPTNPTGGTITNSTYP